MKRKKIRRKYNEDMMEIPREKKGWKKEEEMRKGKK